MHLSEPKVPLQTHAGPHLDAGGSLRQISSRTSSGMGEGLASRRRGLSSASAKPKGEAKPKSKPSIRLAESNETEADADARTEERAAAARERNRLDRDAAVLAVLVVLDLWLSDQVEHGMANFVANAAQSCRTIRNAWSTQNLRDLPDGWIRRRHASLPCLTLLALWPQFANWDRFI